jgi:hypothetical protein
LRFRNALETQRRPQDSAERTVRRAGSLVVACALVVIAAVTLGPSSTGVSLPFFCIACGSIGGVDFVLNVSLFVPLGVGLSLLLRNSARVVLIGLLITLAIEALQWRAIPGRDAALGDIVANSCGAWLGALLTSAAPSLWRARGAQAMRYSVWCSAAAIVIVTVVGFLLLAGPDTSLYRVQWMVTRENQDRFAGTLHSASLNSVPLRPAGAVRSGLFKDTIDLRAVVTGGDSLSRKGAEILRIASFRREAVLLGQRGDALVFRVFTNASRFRFRSPLVALRGQFPSTPPGEARSPQTEIEGRSAPDFVSLAATRGATSSSVTLRRTVGLGWTLILPWNIGVGPKWWPASALWLAVLAFPASFFAARAAQHGAEAANQARVTWWPVALVIGSLVVPPTAMGLSPLDALEWSGVAMGIAGGIGVARVGRKESGFAGSPVPRKDAAQ